MPRRKSDITTEKLHISLPSQMMAFLRHREAQFGRSLGEQMRSYVDNDAKYATYVNAFEHTALGAKAKSDANLNSTTVVDDELNRAFDELDVVEP